MQIRHALSRLVRIGLTVGAAAVLATGLATSAQAATGSIRYFDVNQNEFRIVNPPDNVCLALQVRADLIVDETDKRMTIYLGTACQTRVTTIGPGEARSHIGGPQSVRIIG
ncbi:hypothetical protein [Streptomyces lavendulae]|uniref:hypothetical protein n=1 Tax=Streptomyces lavendulae TaxID=1914 RepID=UPI0024A1D2CF|nr:hypothetical protein Sros01_35380 [Streptomyces roseochromogenus]